MYLAIVTLAPESDGVSVPDAVMLKNAISDLAASRVDLQHVRVSVRAGEIDIALFCGATSVAEADATALALCQRACDVCPLLRGWRVKPPCRPV